MKNNIPIYNKWYFWLFITLIIISFLFFVTINNLGMEIIEKGEYKIIVDTGDNYKELIKTVNKQECPKVECICNSKDNYIPFYQYNFTLDNKSFYNNDNIIYVNEHLWSHKYQYIYK